MAAFSATAPDKVETPAPAPKISKTKGSTLLQEVENSYKKAKGFSAHFKQLTVESTTQTRKESGGMLWFKSPGKFRWDTTEGEKSLAVSDGKTLWFYTPPFDATENGQVLKTAKKKTESKLVEKLLSGAFSLATELKITATSPTIYILTPKKKGSAGTVAKIVLELDAKTKTVAKTTLEHEGGNITEIDLTDVKLGAESGDELFKFVIPPKTDLIEE